MPTWTIITSKQDGSLTTSRKWKTFQINKKVRMDSPPEFTAQIEYDPIINFNDLISFYRDGKVEWKGFIEDIEVAWDESGRYLNIAGRDMTLLLWRKYVENFNNAIKDTGGFFGNVSAVELTKFLLRTPRSDLPMVPDDNVPANQTNSQYPYNKEGWGIDISKFTGLEASKTEYGDINNTVLRKRGLFWSNSGNMFGASDDTVYATDSPMNWHSYGIYPYINSKDGNGGSSYIKSHVGVNDTATFDFQGLNVKDNATGITNCFLMVTYKADASIWLWQSSNCYVYLWVPSFGAWCAVGNFSGRGGSYRTIQFDVSGILSTVSDANAVKIQFVEQGDLSTYIQYCCLSIAYTTGGTISNEDWVNIKFTPETIMGIYIESRETIDQYPRRYHITTQGELETFDGYTESDPHNHITLNSPDNDTIAFSSYNTETAYFYRQGINSGNTGSIGNFDESFSFIITDSQPCDPAFVPWCLANEVKGYYTILNDSSDFTALEVFNSGGNLLLRVRCRVSGSETYFTGLPYLSIGAQYWVHVTRTGSTLIYSVYNAGTMRATELIFTCTFSCSVTFTYRYQAITYNHEDLILAFKNTMDSAIGGEQANNGGFEDGNLNHWYYSYLTLINKIARPSDAQYVHSGNYSAKLQFSEYTETDDYLTENIYGVDIDHCYVWVRLGTLTSEVQFSLWDGSGWNINWTQNVGTSWTEVDILPYLGSAQFRVLKITAPSIDNVYIDDFSLHVKSDGWDNKSGSASHFTDTTIKAPITSNSASQQIVASNNGQGYCFEKDLTSGISNIYSEGWVRIHNDPPASSINEDRHVNNMTLDHTRQYQWVGHGTSPYLNDDDGDGNYVSSDATTVGTFQNEWWFEGINNNLKQGFCPSISEASDCTLTIKARLYNGTNGNAIDIKVAVDVWVQHLNGGAGAWVSNGYFDCTSTIYIEYIFNYMGLTWTSLNDWNNAGVRLNVWGIESSGSDKGGINITYAVIHAKGNLAEGTVYLMKTYNHNIASGPDPSLDYAAAVYVTPYENATTNQTKWRWAIDYYGNSIMGTIISGIVPSLDTWYNIKLYTKIGAGGTGEISLYDITSGSEVLICQYLGISNDAIGCPDRYDFEADFGLSNKGTIWLDDTYVYTLGQAVTNGNIFAGYGPEIPLASVGLNLSPITIWDDESDWAWTPQEGDTNTYSYDTSNIKHGVNSLKISGNGSIPDFAHNLSSSPLDLSSSDYPNISFWFYGLAGGASWTIRFANDITSINYYEGEWYDDVNGWKCVTIPIITFSPQGSPTWNNIKWIEIYSDTALSGTIWFDYLYSACIENLFQDIIHSWKPQKMANIKIYSDEDSNAHGWQITQIYVYKTDQVRFRVVLDGLPTPYELKLTLSYIGYTNCVNNDIGLNVYYNGIFLGQLLDYNNTLFEWYVSVSSASTLILGALHMTILYGTGAGTLALPCSQQVWAGGPYLTLDDTKIDFSSASATIGPLNVPKNRLFDTLWNICVYENDDYFPFEWWISYDNENTFNIAARHGIDKSAGILLTFANDSYSSCVSDDVGKGVSAGSGTIAYLVSYDNSLRQWTLDAAVQLSTGTTISVVSGSGSGILSEPTYVSFTTGINMESIKYQKSSRDTYQRCQTIGSGEGKSQDDVSSFWQNDDDAMSEIHGFFEDIFTQKQIVGARLANRYAKVKLKLDASPKRKNAITCTIGKDSYASFDYTNPTDPNTYDVGDDVTLTDFLSGLSGSYRIYNLTINGDSNGERITLTAQAPYLDISNVWKDVYQTLKMVGVVGTIAQDWSGDGTQSDKISADKLTTIFTKTAKNTDYDVQAGSTNATLTDAPTWYQYPNPVSDGRGWKSTSGNLSIWGPASGNQDFEVEARYAPNYTVGGVLISEEVNIPFTQEPKFTCEFKIYEYEAANISYWAVNDYCEFGMYNMDSGLGLKFRVVKETTESFAIYALFLMETGDSTLDLQTLVNNGKAKRICPVKSGKDGYKYKVEIIVEYNGVQYGNPFPEVLFNVYLVLANDETINNPSAVTAVFTPLSQSFMLQPSWGLITVRPIYIHVNSTGSSVGNQIYRCQMLFYNIKAQQDVV